MYLTCCFNPTVFFGTTDSTWTPMWKHSIIWSWNTSRQGAISAPLLTTWVHWQNPVTDLQNVVVILFCLCCGSEDIFEKGSGCIWVRGTACFHALFWSSGRGPALLMWSQSDLMTITMACFGSTALPRELLPILCLVQKIFPIVFLLPLSFSRQIIRYRPCGGPQAILTGSYTNPVCSSLCSVSFSFSLSLFLFLSLPLFLSVSLCLFLFLSFSLSFSQSPPLPFSLYSEFEVRRWTCPCTLHHLDSQISQDIQCTHEFINI